MTTKTSTLPHRETYAVSGSVDQLSATSECDLVESPSEVTEDAIRERAYLAWEKAGYPEGDGVEFWIAAEKDLQLEIYGCHAVG